MKRPNAASLVLFGFSLGIISSANAVNLGSSVFPDVPSGAYFDSAVGDMYSDGIITGYDTGKFGPNDFVTRGQVAVMMQRFKNKYLGGGSVTVSSSSSSSSVSTATSSSSSVEQSTNEKGSFRFQTASFKVDENRKEVIISVLRYGGTEGNASVDFETTPQSATAGTDYVAISDTLSFGDGEATKTFTIEITDDDNTEDNETIQLRLQNPSSGSDLGNPKEATLTILDDDTGAGDAAAGGSNEHGLFSFSALEYEIADNGEEIDITIERLTGDKGAASIKFQTAHGTADSSNYDSNSGTIEFSDGQDARTFQIKTIKNDDINGNKTVKLTLHTPSGGAALGTRSEATLVIVDDENSSFGSGKLSLKDTSLNVTESDGSVEMIIDRLSGSSGEVKVDYETIDRTAKEGEDYTKTEGTLTFRDGEAQKSVFIPILYDDKNDPNKTFEFKLTNPTGGASLDSDDVATIRIQ